MKRFYLIIIVCIMVLALAGCATPPRTFMRTHDEPGIWKSVEIMDGMTNDKAWEILVDTLSQEYDLEVLEKDAGYLRTSWKYTYVSGGKVVDRYRSRIVVKLTGSPDWTKVQVKCESNWLDNEGWILGYDVRLLEDIYGDIQGKLGRVRR